jgi:hypothetical protein
MTNSTDSNELIETLLAQVSLTEPEYILEVSITTIMAD